MESAHEWAFSAGDRQIQISVVVDEVRHALAHLFCGLVGESNSENGMRCYAFFDQIEDAMRDDARLAGAGSGDNEQWSFRRGHGSLLFGVQMRHGGNSNI